MMSFDSTSGGFWQGFRAGLPFVVILAPFATLFGVLGTEAGLSIAQVMGFSVVVIAGAAQFAALQLMIDNAPTVIVLLTALVVNLRMAMYSASLAPHLGTAPLWQRLLVAYMNVDQSYALSHAEYERDPGQSLSRKLAFFAGIAIPMAPLWYGFTLLGAWAGTAIPTGYGLDFAVPIAFLAMIGPALRTAAHKAAALTSILVALALAWVPYGLGLILAALAAMVVGARVELWLERRR